MRTMLIFIIVEMMNINQESLEMEDLKFIIHNAKIAIIINDTDRAQELLNEALAYLNNIKKGEITNG